MAEEFGARSVARPEQAEDGRVSHDRSGLANATHDGAQVVRLDDNADASRYAEAARSVTRAMNTSSSEIGTRRTLSGWTPA